MRLVMVIPKPLSGRGVFNSEVFIPLASLCESSRRWALLNAILKPFSETGLDDRKLLSRHDQSHGPLKDDFLFPGLVLNANDCAGLLQLLEATN